MKKLIIAVLLIVAAALFGWAYYFGTHGASGLDPAQRLDHQFTVAAYAVTWAVQLAYLARLGLKWEAQKRAADRSR